MRLFSIGARNVGRNPLRTVLAIAAVGVTLLAYVLLRSVSAGWTDQVAQTPNNRVVSRHKVGWSQSMPIHYVEEIRGLPGVKQAMGGSWAGLKYPANDAIWFEATAVQARPFVEMHYELEAPLEQKHAFVENRRAVMVSAELAQELGWKLGDRLRLSGTFLPGDWDVEIACVFRSTRHGFAQRAVWMHWEYFNEKLPAEERDEINIVSAEIFEPRDGANIAKAIDIHFDSRDNQTFTQEDQALNAAFVGMFGALLAAIDVVSLLILGIVFLLVGNAIAMSVRERAQEHAVLRAIGFSPRHLVGLVVWEAAVLGVSGALLALALAVPVVESGISRFLKDEMNLSPVSVAFETALVVVILGALLGALAAVGPGWRATRRPVVEALRRVD